MKTLTTIGLLLSMSLGACHGSPAGPGQECACSSDCAQGLYCTPEAEPPLDLGSSCAGQAVGTCQPLRGEGEICDVVDDIRCEPGLTCNRGTEPSTCIAHDAALGEPCWTTEDCTAGLLCNHGTVPPSCRGPGGVDDPCSADEDCEEGLLCNADRCRPPGVQAEACGEDADCAAGLWCREAGCYQLGCGNGACAALGTGASQEACREDAQCASSTCHLVTQNGFQTLRCG